MADKLNPVLESFKKLFPSTAVRIHVRSVHCRSRGPYLLLRKSHEVHRLLLARKLLTEHQLKRCRSQRILWVLVHECDEFLNECHR